MKRPLLLLAGWLGAAAAAVGIGFLAVSLVDASASPPTQPAAGTTATSTEQATTPAASPSGEQATAGGTVFASCVDGAVRLAGAPAAGWEVEQYADHVEFRGGGQKVEVSAVCTSGAPVFAVEGPRASGGDDGSTPAVTPSSPGVVVDDNGGGHGSDDPPGDDHGGGGHGSDD
jgi:hypothetical protein